MSDGERVLMVLGVTDTLKDTMQLYVDWIQGIVDDAEIVSLSSVRQNLGALNRCDGLVLTGGGDVHPKFYGREDAMTMVHGVDERRDEFEFAVIDAAMKARLPVLGICRGMQICNVALGGTLVPDVQSAGSRNHGKPKDAKTDPVHAVQIVEKTLLHTTVRATHGEVNTHHHQAVDRPAPGLRVGARSLDNVIESIEWETPGGKPFLLLVQWHPERMIDSESPFSLGLIKRFSVEVKASRKDQVVS